MKYKVYMKKKDGSPDKHDSSWSVDAKGKDDAIEKTLKDNPYLDASELVAVQEHSELTKKILNNI